MAKSRHGEQIIGCQGQGYWKGPGKGEVGVSIKGKTMDPCCVENVQYCHCNCDDGYAKLYI